MIMFLVRVFSVFLMMSGPVTAAPAINPFNLPEESHEKLLSGFDALFNSDFAAAEQTLKPLEKDAERHPFYALAQVVRIWWEMTSNVMDADEKEGKKFMDAAERTLALARARIPKGDLTGEAHFVMGTTLGLMSRWSAANRAWVPAYFRGNKSTVYSEKALKINRKAVDAYLTLGTYNYAKALIAERMEKPADEDEKDAGNGQNGLAQLRQAYEKGVYFRPAAGLLLAGILTNEKPQEAAPLLEALRKELPRSGFVHMVLITALYNGGEMDRMERETDDFFKKIESAHYDRSFEPQAYFARGLLAFRGKKWDEAREQFDRAAEAGQPNNPYRTWALLYKGYAFDAMNKRTKAKTQYEAVLKAPRRFASHDHAKARLAKPFRSTDPEMKKVEL